MDRRALTAGFSLATGLGVLAATVLPLPQAVKGYFLGIGAIAATASFSLSVADERYAPHRQAVLRSDAIALQERMAANHAYQQAVAESMAQLNLYHWVKAQPVQYHSALLTEHDLWQFEPQPAMVAAAANTPAPGAIAVQVGGVIDQPSILQQLEQDTALDTTWFNDWERRSGIVCGESGDGKTKLLVYMLARFLEQQRGEVYICDPDYGSSHGDSEPNNWLGLKLGTHISVNPADVLTMVGHVSAVVDRRADQTAIAISQGQPKPQYPPVLLILDEAPAVMAQLPKEAQEQVKLAIANILRRGLKQNVTFKLGTQTLAVGSLGLTQDLLRQIETVVLWRAAQVCENFANLGINKSAVEAAVGAIAQLPRKVGGVFACVTYLGKNLEVRGIPEIGEILVNTTPAAQQEVASHPPVEGDCYEELLGWMRSQGIDLKALTEVQRRAIASKFGQITKTPLSEAGLRALIEYLERIC